MNMEVNKILAAFLIAGIVAMISGFIASGVISTGGHGEHQENAYHIDVAEASTSGTKVKKVAVAEPISALLASADIEKGKKLSKACASCHSFNKGGKAKTGPNLWNIVGRDIGSVNGFAYSSAMKEKGGKWDYKELNSFIWKPRKTMAGTKMTYIGMKKTKQRADIIAWMRTLSDNPKPLP